MNFYTRLFSSVGTASFADALVELLGTEISFDGSCVLFFHPDHPPQAQGTNLTNADSVLFWRKYMNGTYVLDPYYQLCQLGERGVFRIKDIAPAGFPSSEYYQSYYLPAGIEDEINIVYQGDNSVSGLVSLSRSEKRNPFSQSDEDALRKLEELTSSALTAHMRSFGISFGEPEKRYNKRLVQQRLENFAKRRVTGREYEIVQLLLLGQSSKQIARKLNITAETERTHRKSIYKKLAINSHAELLADALEFLVSDSPKPSLRD
jgi:DNA-binding CsgD family transcriptional regulator